MRFDEVRVGDRVRTHAEFTDGTVIKSEFTVTYVDTCGYVFGNDHINTRSDNSDRKSLSIELVSRPMTPPKVGDLLTSEQVQALPNLAVFLSARGVPSTVLNGMSYAPGFPAGVPLSYHDITDPVYRLIYLPDEEN